MSNTTLKEFTFSSKFKFFLFPPYVSKTLNSIKIINDYLVNLNVNRIWIDNKLYIIPDSVEEIVDINNNGVLLLTDNLHTHKFLYLNHDLDTLSKLKEHIIKIKNS
jgi:hypothetical protein